MLNARQQHCLQGIGIQIWRERGAADNTRPVSARVSEPVAEIFEPRAPATGEPPWSGEAVAPGAADQPRPDPVAKGTDADQAQPAPPAFEFPALDDWNAIDSAIEACTACELSQNCTRKVPGIGDRQADLLIIGEGPGHDEDLRGEPFVGRSGQLLDRMLAAIGLGREQVYITNIVKCRPPNNRDPRPEEAQQCRVYLDAQISQLQPKVILSVGRVSAHNLLDSKLPVGKLIRETHQLPGTDIPLKVTYHPAYLLRNPSAKAIAWQDMKLLYRLLQ